MKIAALWRPLTIITPGFRGVKVMGLKARDLYDPKLL